MNPKYTDKDLKVLDKLLEKHKGVVQSYKTYQAFKKQFPNINLMVDLKTYDQIIEMYYPKMREKIFELLTKADLKSGLINYDSDTGRMQVVQTKYKTVSNLEGREFVEKKLYFATVKPKHQKNNII